jgi:glycine cleavage system H protein
LAEDKKKVVELTFPAEISYHKEHTWARVEGGQVKVGISDFAQDQLGDIIFIELPQVGDAFLQGKEFGSAESAKSVSALNMPVGGKIVAVNSEIEDAPDLVNKDPYGAGWMIVIQPNDSKEVEGLLTNEQYRSQL